jgi:hypothetical protein
MANRYTFGNKGGRPPHYNTPEELESAIIEYFDSCSITETKATITGIALFLGFDSRQSFYDYGDRDQFSYIIKRARLAVENSYETSGGTIDIFALKNMGWKDKVEQEITGSIPVTLNETRTFHKPNETYQHK